MSALAPKTILMTGLSGLIGRWTAARLTKDGHRIVAPLRQAESRRPGLIDWINAHGGDGSLIDWIDVDLAAPDFIKTLEGATDLAALTHIYSFAAAMEWHLDPKVARQINVEAVRALLARAAGLPAFERFVHISGYLVTSKRHQAHIGFEPAKLAQEKKEPTRALARLYKRIGAYEASKIEADYLVRRAAVEGLPVTILNPSTVIGSTTDGEAHQVYGLEGILDGLATGTFAAIPGNTQDWIPLVAIDHLADFAAKVPLSDQDPLTDYVLLSQGTPTLPDMVAIIAGEMGVKAPRRRVPLWALKALLNAGLEDRLGVPLEGLVFINDYRYDTTSAEAAATRHGLVHGDIVATLRKTVRYWYAVRQNKQAA